MNEIYIPAATLEKLNGVWPKGTRHEAKKQIIIPMVGNGVPSATIVQMVKEKFPEADEKEIVDLINWAVKANPTPSGYGNRTGTGAPPNRQLLKPASKKPAARSPADQCDWWLNGKKTTPVELTATSPVAFKGSPVEQLVEFFEMLYAPDERLNIVCRFTMREEKANPQGGGKTMTRTEWCDYFKKSGIPQSDAGAWLRMNPCNPGSGSDGAITDVDVTAWAFMLLESDVIPAETMMALFQNLRLPIAAVIKSGGKSVHGWVKLNSADETEYAAMVLKVVSILKPFGLDASNKNPSRLSRLPSAHRKIQAHGDGMQSLLYLNPAVKPLKLEDLAELEARLEMPLADEQPMRTMVNQASRRYMELYENRGKLGVQVGFREFDRDTGGFKPGQMTTIAAETNKGKSTLLINMVYGALVAGHGVALFTLEMDREEIMDLLIANHCRVNRNVFNTGYFNDGEIQKITAQSGVIGKFPLWVFDDAVMTVEDIDKRIGVLVADGKIEIAAIDYLQIVSARDTRAPREQQVAEIARDIRVMAKRRKLPFIVLSQLNDEGKLRESRVVGHESHNVIQLDIDDGSMDVVKGRRIRKKSYKLSYEPEFARVTMPFVDEVDVPKYNQNKD